MTRVRVEWVDSYDLSGGPWHTQEDVEKALEDDEVIVTLGTLISENAKYLAVATSASGRAFCGVHIIPKVCVRKRRVIR